LLASFDLARWPGVELYLRLVAANKAAWDGATTKAGKRRVARAIYDAILGTGGRFLERLGGMGPWFVQDERQSLAKIGRALKDYVGPQARAAAAAARLGRRLGRRVDGPPGPSDVLGGRGGRVNTNWGNARFRALCHYYADTYAAMSPEQKAHLIRTLVRVWREHGGRFLIRFRGDLYEDRDDLEVHRNIQRRLLRLEEEEVVVVDVDVDEEEEDGDADDPAEVDDDGGGEDQGNGGGPGPNPELMVPPAPADEAVGVVNEAVAQPAAARALTDEGRGRIDESDFATSRFQSASPRLPSGHGFRQQHGADDDGDRKLVREDVCPTDPTCPR
jgi:hypothetical protein